MKLPPLYEVVQIAIIGFVAGSVFSGLWWLVTRELPDGGELWMGSWALIWLGGRFLDAQKEREVRSLREMYEAPSDTEK